MILTVAHYRIRRGIRLLDAEGIEWRDCLDGCEAAQVGNVLDVIRQEMPYPFNVEPKTARHFATLNYYGLYDTPGDLWLELKDQPVPLNIVPLGPPSVE